MRLKEQVLDKGGQEEQEGKQPQSELVSEIDGGEVFLAPEEHVRKIAAHRQRKRAVKQVQLCAVMQAKPLPEAHEIDAQQDACRTPDEGGDMPLHYRDRRLQVS